MELLTQMWEDEPDVVENNGQVSTVRLIFNFHFCSFKPDQTEYKFNAKSELDVCNSTAVGTFKVVCPPPS